MRDAKFGKVNVYGFRDRLKYYVERWVQRGALAQLTFIVAVIVLIALLGGLVSWALSDQFEHPGHAIWWAFLRLTDPGYLGEDEGALLRVVSTTLTVLGFVVFLGSLVAILTQWLNETMESLESGLTPIAIRNHILILGWTNRTPTIIQELLLSEGRVRRFLIRRGVRRLRIVVLAERVDAALRQELRDAVSSSSLRRRVILRSGTSLRVEHLRRVAYRHASVIILPGADFYLGGATATDARVIKTLISLAPGPHGPSPALVAEIFDSQKTAVAENAYRGGEIDVVASDGFISRLIAQNVRHRGLSYVYAELLSHTHGSEVYVRSFPDWAGRRFGELSVQFPTAILIGIVRPDGDRFTSRLNPEATLEVEADDRLVFIAHTYEECTPTDVSVPGTAGAVPVGSEPEVPIRRILVLGWSHKVMSLAKEFAGYPGERFEIDVLSRVEVEKRNTSSFASEGDAGDVRLRHLQGDYTIRDTLVAARPSEYDNVVFLASDWMDTEEESDARTILGYVVLRSILDGRSTHPEVLIELMDPENSRLFRQRSGEVIISPVILSHILSHVALRRELSAVFSELFGPGGAEFFFRSASELDLVGRSVGMTELRGAAQARNEIALGLRIADDFERSGGGVHLNPGPDRRWTLAENDEVIVLAGT